MIFAYLRSLGARFFRRAQTEHDLEDELDWHIQMRADALERSGVARDEAERRARIEFGSPERFKEECREAVAGNYIEMFLCDLRFGARILLKNPGFTILAGATLALAIGANTGVFSAFNSLVLSPLPFESPDQLVRIYSTKNGMPIQVTGNPGGPSPMDVRDFAQSNHTFQKIVAYDTWRKNVSFSSGRGAPEQMRVGLVPGTYFEILGLRPVIGRLFLRKKIRLGVVTSRRSTHDFGKSAMRAVGQCLDRRSSSMTSRIRSLP
ncbi:MAG TPA: permease prefix domain 1-containing protein [Chthoniobacterales bacterium]|nr:permease prefix domain 1-containing protein [Chthoniobacterales bacterium]